MPAFQIQKSIEISAPIEKVFSTVADFATWSTWSPWLCTDPDATVTVGSPSDQVGSTYQWEGEIVGIGNMAHRNFKNNESIESDLAFVKPFKSESNVRFDFQEISTENSAENGDQTKVTWTMNGNLPFFLFWMKAKMVAYVGMDYERGLLMLKDLIETGTIPSKVQWIGTEKRPRLRFMGVSDHCSMKEIECSMDKTFKKVFAAFEQASVPRGEMISIYLPSSDMQNGEVDYVSGIATEENVAGLQETILAEGDYMHVRHTGSYKHLGNAWSCVYQNAMKEKRKPAKSPSYETYVNDPSETDEADLITDIYLPVR